MIKTRQTAVWLLAMLLFFILTPFSLVRGESEGMYPVIFSLNGIWEKSDVEGGFNYLNERALKGFPGEKWKEVRIPAHEGNPGSHFAAYRKTFKHPVNGVGEKAYLHFKGVSFACQIYLNGNYAGSHGPTLEPFSTELTEYLKESNELIVVVQDWTSGIEMETLTDLSKPLIPEKGIAPTVDFAVASPFDRSIWFKTISPMGGNYSQFGMWDDVWLEVVKEVNVTEVFIESLVNEGKIKVRGNIQGFSSEKRLIEVSISVKGAPEKKAVGKYEVETGKEGGFEIFLNAEGLERWEPNNPAIYEMVLEARSSDDKLLFHRVIPFGYRQVTMKNHELSLNDKKIHLFTASTSNNGMKPDELRTLLMRLKELNLNTVRFHANIFPEWYYELADRMGMMVVAESAINGSYVVQNNYESDVFFENAAIHWKGLVNKLKNHPSVVAYSIENECVEYSHGMRAETKFAELGKKVKLWDPTRPILFNGGDDPGGIADILSLHYPHELPFWNKYPKDAWWLRETMVRSQGSGVRGEAEDARLRGYAVTKIGGNLQPTSGQTGKRASQQADPSVMNHELSAMSQNQASGIRIDSFWYKKPNQLWSWDKKKPLDLGEIGYFDGGEPYMDSILFGDEAYNNYLTIRDKTQAETWKHSIEAARAMDVAMINPWNPPAGEKANEALKEALKPIKIIFYPERFERFYGKSTLKWSGVIVNDLRETKNLYFQYAVKDEKERPLYRKKLGPFLVPPGEMQSFEIEFNVPEVEKPLTYNISGEIIEDNGTGKVYDQFNYQISAYPKPEMLPWKKMSMVGLFDPQGDTASLFKRLKIPHRRVNTIGKYENIEMLVVGRRALTGLSYSDVQKLQQRMKKRDLSTLLLDQEHYPFDFPGGLTLNTRHSTAIGFIRSLHHPVMEFLKEKDFQLWAPDMVISYKDFNLPTGGSYKPLLIGGGTGGLIYSPLIEQSQGNGNTVFCQLPLVEKFWNEPIAAELLFRMLRYMDRKTQSKCESRIANRESGHQNGKDLMIAAGFSLRKNGKQSIVILPENLKNNLKEMGVEIDNSLRKNAKTIKVIKAADFEKTGRNLVEWKNWIQKGNVLYLYGMEPESLKNLSGLLSAVNLVPLTQEKLPVKVNHTNLLTDGMASHYLYWTEPYPMITYQFAKLISPSKWMFDVSSPKGASNFWFPLTAPSLIMASKVGKGFLLVDTINWDELIRAKSLKQRVGSDITGRKPLEIYDNDDNYNKAVRFFCTLLTNLGAKFAIEPLLQIEAENMSEKTPGQPIIRNREHYYWGIFKNNYIAEEFYIHQTSTDETPCFVEARARNRVNMEIAPLMRVVVDGKIVGECFVEEPSWRVYRFRVNLKAGKHRVEIHLVNNPDDAYNHRYLYVDWIRFRASSIEGVALIKNKSLF
ncbi:MAG: hypothetical protein NT178_16830 [Proteobacteria bacterium]|nr:hypothetical protein [Pseudomonadota bacterium]